MKQEARCQFIMPDGALCKAPDAVFFDERRQAWVCKEHQPACEFCGTTPAVHCGFGRYRCVTHTELRYEMDDDEHQHHDDN